MKSRDSKKPSTSPKKRSKNVESNDNAANETDKNTRNNESEESFPGYPHYPSDEDILNNSKKQDIDVENFSRLGNTTGKGNSTSRNADNEMESPVPKGLKEDDIEGVPESEADITDEDLQLLPSDELNGDLGEDELLMKRIYPVDMAGSDLDVPGAELDDNLEDLGEEDEENNPYSIGGDRHEDLDGEDDRER